MITFKELKYRNFQAVGNTWVTIQLDRSPTTIIGGQNGSGKSTVLESLSYALFGKPLKKVNLAGLINTSNKKGLEVQVTWESKGKTYKVIRGQKPGKFEFYIDDELVDQSANSRDYQAKIEYHLGMDYKLFTQIVVLNKEKYVPFMELGAADRRKVIEDILDIGVFSVMSDLLKEDIKAHSNKLEDLKYERDKLGERIKGQERLIAESSANIDELVRDASDAIDELYKECDAKTKEVEEIKALLSEFDDCESNLKDINKRKGDFEKLAVKFQEKIKSIEKTIKFFEETDVCPTCGNDIEEDQKSSKHADCNAEITNLRETSKDLMSKYQEVVEEAKAIQAELVKKDKLNIELVAAKNDIQFINKQISIKEKEIESLRSKSKNDQYEEELKELNRQHQEMTDSLEDLIVTEAHYKACRDILKDDGIKAHIVSDYIEFINLKMNEYMNAMEFHLNITLDAEFNETINSINRAGFTYDNLSSGQKSRVNLAIWLALLEVASIKNSVVTNILLLDEVLENIDSQGVGLFMGLVKEHLPHKNFFVVTQRFDEFSDYFRSEIKFKLNGDFTELA